ncbi:MAG: hypothetical protein WAL67_08325, partial [Candidatus Cybelea sp.]
MHDLLLKKGAAPQTHRLGSSAADNQVALVATDPQALWVGARDLDDHHDAATFLVDENVGVGLETQTSSYYELHRSLDPLSWQSDALVASRDREGQDRLLEGEGLHT